MSDFEPERSSADCGDVGGTDAARYAFLAAVNHLPHVALGRTATLDLTHTIEAEIIPRLILAHRADQGRHVGAAQAGMVVPAAAMELFGKHILHDDLDAAIALVADLGWKGVPVETIMLEVLAPTAARLGEMWEADDVDFVEVALSLQRLQQVLRSLSGAQVPETVLMRAPHRILLATTPGEAHIFSLLLVDQFFRGDGWDVWTMPGATAQELVELVAREDFAMVGLSVSCEELLFALTSLIAEIRKATRREVPAIMVGGPILTLRPELTKALGADATARDGASAVIEGRRLVEARAVG